MKSFIGRLNAEWIVLSSILIGVCLPIFLVLIIGAWSVLFLTIESVYRWFGG